MTIINGYRQNLLVQANVRAMQSDIAQIEKQLNTGRKSDAFGAYGAKPTGEMLSLRGTINRTESYDTTVNTLAMRAALADQALQAIPNAVKATQELATRLRLNNQQFPGDLRKTATDALTDVVSLMNSEVGGYHVFAGTTATTPPVTSATEILDGVRTAVKTVLSTAPGPLSFDDLAAVVDAHLNPPGGPSRWASPGATPADIRISDTKTVAQSQTLMDPANPDDPFRSLITQLAVLAVVDPSDPATLEKVTGGLTSASLDATVTASTYTLSAPSGTLATAESFAFTLGSDTYSVPLTPPAGSTTKDLANALNSEVSKSYPGLQDVRFDVDGVTGDLTIVDKQNRPFSSMAVTDGAGVSLITAAMTTAKTSTATTPNIVNAFGVGDSFVLSYRDTTGAERKLALSAVAQGEPAGDGQFALGADATQTLTNLQARLEQLTTSGQPLQGTGFRFSVDSTGQLGIARDPANATTANSQIMSVTTVDGRTGAPVTGADVLSTPEAIDEVRRNAAHVRYMDFIEQTTNSLQRSLDGSSTPSYSSYGVALGPDTSSVAIISLPMGSGADQTTVKFDVSALKHSTPQELSESLNDLVKNNKALQEKARGLSFSYDKTSGVLTMLDTRQRALSTPVAVGAGGAAIGADVFAATDKDKPTPTAPGIKGRIADNGRYQAVLENQLNQHKELRTQAGKALGDIETVDPYEAITRLQQLQSNLETSYRVTSELRKLTLANYL